MKLQIFVALVFCIAVASAADSAPKPEIHSVRDLAEKIYSDVTSEMGKERSALFTTRDFIKFAEIKYLTPDGRALVDGALEYLPDFSSILKTVSTVVKGAAHGAISGDSKSDTSTTTSKPDTYV